MLMARNPTDEARRGMKGSTSGDCAGRRDNPIGGAIPPIPISTLQVVSFSYPRQGSRCSEAKLVYDHDQSAAAATASIMTSFPRDRYDFAESVLTDHASYLFLPCAASVISRNVFCSQSNEHIVLPYRFVELSFGDAARAICK